MKKLEWERKQEDLHFEAFYREFQNGFSRMSFMIRKEDEIIKMEMERRDVRDKGVKFETRPIDLAPTIYKVKGHTVTIETPYLVTSRKTTEHVRKLEKGKAKMSYFIDVQEEFDTNVPLPLLALCCH